MIIGTLPLLEHLSERQAAEAVRARIGWKYLPDLELTDSDIDFSTPSAGCDHLLEGQAETLHLAVRFWDG